MLPALMPPVGMKFDVAVRRRDRLEKRESARSAPPERT